MFDDVDTNNGGKTKKSSCGYDIRSIDKFQEKL